MPQRVIVVTGATGLLGPYLMDAAKQFGQVVGLARRGAEITCNLADGGQTQSAIQDLAPDVIVHAAAMTNVDECESDPALADRMNRAAAANAATAMNDHGSFVYMSTDQVYPDKAGPHTEGDEAPVNAYGRSKLAGETAVQLGHPKVLIVRTNLFGPSRTKDRTSLSDFVVGSLTEGSPITLFTDVMFSPLHMTALAEIVFEMVAKQISGVFNVGSRDGMSKRDFGHLVAHRFGLSVESATDGVSSAVPGRAPRPRDLRMNVGKVEAALGRAMPTCREQVALL
jgi:dTDP-4-dehydrorhamnose reductase